MTVKIVGARIVLATAVAAAVLSVAACGRTAGHTATATPAAPTTADATTAATTTADAVGGDCGGVPDAVVKAVPPANVQKIQVIGGCSMISIETSLDPTDRAGAEQICDAVAKVAYTGAVVSVSVDGADGHELSAGMKNAPCI
jgi:hypothetical protein